MTYSITSDTTRTGWHRLLIVLALLAMPAALSAQTGSPASEPQPVDAAIATSDTAPAISAQSLVAPSGQPIQSTEESDFGTTVLIAPKPSVVLNGNEMTGTEGGSTEAIAVKSGADLLLKLGVVAPRIGKERGQREMDEPTTSTALLEQEQIRKLLGDSPTVVYHVVYQKVPIPDPMIIPWVRNAVLLKERFDEAINLLAQQRVQEGIQALRAIEYEFPDSEYAMQAKQILKRLSDISAPPPPPTAKLAKAAPSPTPLEIQIDPNIRVGTVLADPTDAVNNRVSINGQVLGVGQVVRGFSSHKVVKIEDGTVTIEVELRGQRKQFVVPVRKTGF
jgi:hypothetical protein